DGTTLWAAESDGEAAQAYDLATGARRSADDIALTAKRYVTTALWSEDGTLWVANALGEAVAYRLSDGARVASADLDGMLSSAGNGEPVGLWSDGSVLYVVDRADAHLYAYGSDGVRLPDREFGLSREERSRAQWGLWSDGETLWVADSLLPRLLAYAVPGLRRTSGTGLLPVVVSNRAAAVPSLDPGPPAHLPDAGLRARIAVALGKAPEDPVGVNELLALESLDARGAGIADLTGLEYATNLTALDLSHNPLADLRVLGSLPHLAVLNLDGTGTEPWALAGLTGLARLSLRGNGVAEVMPLGGLARLQALDVGDNAVADVSPLSGLTNLRALSLRGNAVRDVRSLAALPRLLELDVTGNRIGDFGPLAGNARLTVEGREAQAAGISP
ncbi:MAG: leucine-rich repeat domain-containing protein, partial [Rhodospirillales bacterium]|nr:leucine-rich repeat domain-containing protein [Rhodospirillales bacterium]